VYTVWFRPFAMAGQAAPYNITMQNGRRLPASSCREERSCHALWRIRSL